MRPSSWGRTSSSVSSLWSGLITWCTDTHCELFHEASMPRRSTVSLQQSTDTHCELSYEASMARPLPTYSKVQTSTVNCTMDASWDSSQWHPCHAGRRSAYSKVQTPTVNCPMRHPWYVHCQPTAKYRHPLWTVPWGIHGTSTASLQQSTVIHCELSHEAYMLQSSTASLQQRVQFF